MVEQTLDIWSVHGKPKTYVGILTNETINNKDRLVMGRGTALQAVMMFPNLDKRIASLIQSTGNRPYILSDIGLFTFPTKYNWWEISSMSLIRQSAETFKTMIKDYRYKDCKFYLPRPGCGNGRLYWKDVKPLLVDLPDNVICVDRG